MSQFITHRGRVAGVYPDHITVSINKDADECHACAIAAMCGKGESIDVPIRPGDRYEKGQSVCIGAPIGVQRQATVLLLAVPIVLLIAVVAIATALGIDSIAASLTAISAVALWYVILYLMRLKVREKSVFRVLDT